LRRRIKMGFIKENYINEKMGISLEKAYARIHDISIDGDNHAQAIFVIQQSREATYDKQPIDGVVFETDIDRNKLIYEQVYSSAKETVFADWENDIPLDVEAEVIEGE
jgi:hypothetical protein